jgi:uncharacterized protein YndB with AHSA1/START domain
MLLESVSQPSEGSGIAPGTVEITRALSASATTVWRALTDPAIVAKWFGTLTSPFSVAESANLEFGDGDYFLIHTLRIDPPFLLQYSWRFLGIGPLDTITWRIIPQGDGCLVTVTDTEPERSREAALLLRTGWMDFTGRLEEFISQGTPTRYPWRHEFDASIKLTGSTETVWNQLFEPRSEDQWLSLSASDFNGELSLFVDDGNEPTAFKVSNVHSTPPLQVQFHLTHKDWLHPTACNLSLIPHGQNSLLSVSHNGWEGISPQSGYQKQQRKRFSAFWIAALRRAATRLYANIANG